MKEPFLFFYYSFEEQACSLRLRSSLVKCFLLSSFSISEFEWEGEGSTYSGFFFVSVFPLFPRFSRVTQPRGEYSRGTQRSRKEQRGAPRLGPYSGSKAALLLWGEDGGRLSGGYNLSHQVHESIGSQSVRPERDFVRAQGHSPHRGNEKLNLQGNE